MAGAIVEFQQYISNQQLALNADFLREATQLLTWLLVEVEVSQQIGAQRHQRTTERQTYRNGY